MNLKSFLALLMLTTALTAWARLTAVAVCPAEQAAKLDDDTIQTSTRSLVVYSDIKDHLTHDPIKGVKAELLWAADSTHADTVHVEYHEEEYYKSSFMEFPIKQAGNYLVKVEAEGYVTKYVPFEVKKIYKRERYLTMKTIYLRTIPKKDDIVLDEFVVTATKLKFYMNCDTLRRVRC